MRNTLFDISDKISPSILEILSLIDEITQKHNVDFFVTGATARDIILNMVYNIKVPRATNDIDFAIRINTWEKFDTVITDLISKGFEKTNIIHRFNYHGFPVDFVPFGGIVNDKFTFRWPDKNEMEMNVLGFGEVYENADSVKVSKKPAKIIKFASVEGLTILKLVVWSQTPARSLKDANDLLLIMKTYVDAGNLERLMNDHSDLVNDAFDYELTGARLLGRDVAKISSNETLKYILSIFNNEIENRPLSKLADEMGQYELAFEDLDNKNENILNLLNSFKQGLVDQI